MYEVRVYNRNRDIPYVIDGQQTHIHLIAGSPKLIDDDDLVNHLRLFHNPAAGRGIEIVKVEEKEKSVRSMSLDELREFAISKGAGYDDSDSRMEIMKKIRGDK